MSILGFRLFAVLWPIGFVVGLVLGDLQSGARLMVGNLVVVVGAVAAVVAGLRLRRALGRCPPMPSSTVPERLAARDRIRAGTATADDRLAHAVATRLATGRQRALAIAAPGLMLAGVAVETAGCLLYVVVAASVVCAAVMAARLLRWAAPARRYLALH